MTKRYQGSLFDIPAALVAHPQPAKVPPLPAKIVVSPVLGQCVRCGHDATVASPSGNPHSIYCEQCGRCGGGHVTQTALGIEVRVCGNSVEHFVYDEIRGIWRCPCMITREVKAS